MTRDVCLGPIVSHTTGMRPISSLVTSYELESPGPTELTLDWPRTYCDSSLMLRKIMFVGVFWALLAVAGCGGDDGPDEDTLQGCVEIHEEELGLSEVDAIAECLLDELALV